MDEKKNTKEKTKQRLTVIAIIVILLLFDFIFLSTRALKETSPQETGGTEWNGILDLGGTETASEGKIIITGYSSAVVTKGSDESESFPLVNAKANTENMVFYVYNEENELLAETLPIAPNHVENVNVYDKLHDGENRLTVKIEARDSETGEKYPTVANVTIAVEKK